MSCLLMKCNNAQDVGVHHFALPNAKLFLLWQWVVLWHLSSLGKQASGKEIVTLFCF